MPRQRILSEFMCREMLYDYAAQALKAEDRAAVELALEEYPQLKDELRQIFGAFNYCANLAKTGVNEALLSELLNGDSFLSSLIERWNRSSRLVKWGIPAVFFCFLAIVVLRIFIPNWNVHGVPDTLTLAKIDREAKITPEADESIGLAARPNGSATQSETIKAAASTSSTSTTTSTSPVTSTTLLVPASGISTTLANGEQPSTLGQGSVTTTTRREGFVYRTFVRVSDSDEAATQTKAKILELGGTKAGEVDLGWQASDGRYFHFVIKESDYAAMESFLKSLGPVRIQKIRHPRVMPEGQIRFILLIQDMEKAAKHEEGEPKSEDTSSDNDSGADTGGGKSDVQQSPGQPDSSAIPPAPGSPQEANKKEPQ